MRQRRRYGTAGRRHHYDVRIHTDRHAVPLGRGLAHYFSSALAPRMVTLPVAVSSISVALMLTDVRASIVMSLCVISTLDPSAAFISLRPPPCDDTSTSLSPPFTRARSSVS